MGAILSFRRSGDTDYEQVLADLDEKIRRSQAHLAEIKLREKKWGVVFLIYAVFAYALYVLLFYAYLNQHHEPLQTWLFKFAPVAIGPFAIYYVRKIIHLWYRRRQASAEAYVVTLKGKQRAKVEELKKKTAYYSTKNLLERYDLPRTPVDPAKPTRGQRPGNPAVPSAVAGTKRPPASSPAGPAGNLRQRLPIQGSGGPPTTNLTGRPGPGPSPLSPQGPVPLGPGSPSPALGPHPRMPPASMAAGNSPQSRAWYDKLVDKIVGDEGPETKYALVCRNCFAHNGLVLPDEIQHTQYVCPKCGYFNGRKDGKPILIPPKSQPGDSTPQQTPRRAGPRHSVGGALLHRERMTMSPPGRSAIDQTSHRGGTQTLSRADRLRADASRRQTLPAHLVKPGLGGLPADDDDDAVDSSLSGSEATGSDGDLASNAGNESDEELLSGQEVEDSDEPLSPPPAAAADLNLGNITNRRSAGASSNPAVVKKNEEDDGDDTDNPRSRRPSSPSPRSHTESVSTLPSPADLIPPTPTTPPADATRRSDSEPEARPSDGGSSRSSSRRQRTPRKRAGRR
ncbi:hypothetical protein IWQ60_006089 [Tieghemiomyces parasiticus]|uniref:Endoplasmic reticulum junction formation protein lunapark n=1 Tax=Tieghemiomyces parasiticus TaxID=78921 RepID=A0A9W8ADL7_9FUNG|nr:hypothetical protein IWQ60_006089 [Tieghemiomyces parasiticus]